MKMTDILKKVIGLSLLVAAVAGTVAYIVFKITGERAYREKTISTAVSPNPYSTDSKRLSCQLPRPGR